MKHDLMSKLVREVGKSQTSSAALWDDGDPAIIKGLAMAGKNSKVWGMAMKYNPECIKKAEELIWSGWKPINHEIPSVKTCEEPF